MEIFLNERKHELKPGMTAGRLRNEVFPEADKIVVNGFPASGDEILSDGDTVTVFRAGEMPPPEMFEALMAARHTPGVHRRIKQAVLGIAGLGGLGSTAGLALVRLGAGKMIVADYDIVEPSNLNRQQYFAEQIGMKKTEAFALNARKINPRVKIELHDIVLDRDNLPRIFSACDVILECFDTPAAKRMAYAVARTSMKDKTFVMVSGIAGSGDAMDIRVRKAADNVFLVGDGESAAGPGRGLMSPRVTVAAGMQANIALNVILERAQ